MASHVKDLNY